MFKKSDAPSALGVHNDIYIDTGKTSSFTYFIQQSL